MKKLRLWTVLLILWLIFFFNIERIGSPVNIRSYTYIFVAVVAAITLLIPRVQRLPFLILLTAPVLVFLWFKVFMEKGSWQTNLLEGYALPLTVTQVSSILLTGLLARQINYGLKEFEDVITNITFSHIGKRPVLFSNEQGPMYREVKRARRYQRPLAIVALKVDASAFQVLLPQVVEEVQQAMMKEYMLAGIARVLDETMYDFDTIALRDDSFILVLPEVIQEELPTIIQRLEKAVLEEKNVKLHVGTASFPAEAETFESLIELALAKAQQAAIEPILAPANQQTVTQKIW